MKPNWRRDALIVLGAAAGMSALFIAKALCSLPEWDAGYLSHRGAAAHIHPGVRSCAGAAHGAAAPSPPSAAQGPLALFVGRDEAGETLEGEVGHARQVVVHLAEEAAGNLAQRLAFDDAAVAALAVVGGVVGTGGVPTGTDGLF